MALTPQELKEATVVSYLLLFNTRCGLRALHVDSPPASCSRDPKTTLVDFNQGTQKIVQPLNISSSLKFGLRHIIFAFYKKL